MTRGLAAGLALLWLVVPAIASDYPYSGYFAAGVPGEHPDEIRLNCANGFFQQGVDGSFINYHLDAASYDRTGAVRYVRYATGTCDLLDGGRIEACKMTTSTDASEIGAVYVDSIDSIEPEVVFVRFFDSLDEARSHLAGKGPDSDRSFFVRCTGLTDEILAGHLTTELSTLGLDDRDALIAPEHDEATRARLQAILDLLLANR